MIDTIPLASSDRPDTPDCSQCGGVGWVEVNAPHARGTNGGAISVIPCRWCRPGQSARFHGGHMDPHHNRRACEECRDDVGFAAENPGHGR